MPRSLPRSSSQRRSRRTSAPRRRSRRTSCYRSRRYDDDDLPEPTGEEFLQSYKDTIIEEWISDVIAFAYDQERVAYDQDRARLLCRYLSEMDQERRSKCLEGVQALMKHGE